jgi:hypothetical protein
MATFTWYLQGGTNTEIRTQDKIQFGSGAFNSAITVNSYNDSTHVLNGDDNTDKSSGNTPKNSKYLTSSTVDLGSGSVAVNTATNSNAPLKINFSHGTSVATNLATFFSYDGTTTTSGPTDVNFYCAEIGDSSWTNAEGSASAMTLDDNTASTSHDFYLLISASPTSVGLKSDFKMRIELTYF